MRHMYQMAKSRMQRAGIYQKSFYRLQRFSRFQVAEARVADAQVWKMLYDKLLINEKQTMKNLGVSI